MQDKAWKPKLAQNDNIVALKAKINKLQGKLDSQEKSLLLAQTQQSNLGRSNNDRSVRQIRGQNISLPAWKIKAPGVNEPHEMTRNGRTFYWCKHHKFWTASHYSDTYRMKNNDGDSRKTTQGGQRPTLSLNTATLPLSETSDIDLFIFFCTKSGMLA